MSQADKFYARLVGRYGYNIRVWYGPGKLSDRSGWWLQAGADSPIYLGQTAHEADQEVRRLENGGRNVHSQ